MRSEADPEDQLERDHDHVVEAPEREQCAGDPGRGDPDADRSLALDEPRHRRDQGAGEDGADEPRQRAVGVDRLRQVGDRLAGAERQHTVDRQHHGDRAARDDVEDRRDRPQLGDLPPRVALLPVQSCERDEEVLREELAAADDEEHETDAEPDGADDVRGILAEQV